MTTSALPLFTSTGSTLAAVRGGREGKSMPCRRPGHCHGFAHSRSAVALASTRDRAGSAGIKDGALDSVRAPLAPFVGSASRRHGSASQARQAPRAATARQNPARSAQNPLLPTRAVLGCHAKLAMEAARVLWGPRRPRAVRCPGIFEKTRAFFDLPSPFGRHLDTLDTPALEL